MPEFRANTLNDVVRMAVGREQSSRKQAKRIQLAQKQIAEVYAPPLFWGPWIEIFAQFGVIGDDREKHVTRVNVSFKSISEVPSSFDVQIDGGDRFISTFGPGSELVTITGNVATSLKIRAKSHTVGQMIDVDVRQLR